MKTLTYNKANRLRQFCDELFAAVPALLTANPDGTFTTSAEISGTAARIVVVVDDAIPTADIDAVVAAHVATAEPPRVNPWTALKNDLTAAATLADVKAALVQLATKQGG